jgi:hypothetical protein
MLLAFFMFAATPGDGVFWSPLQLAINTIRMWERRKAFVLDQDDCPVHRVDFK